MHEHFADMLTIGGKTNSLGRVNDVIQLVLNDRGRLEELYACMFHDDAWVRMRAADALEKVCRQHPDWLTPYVDRFLEELSDSSQPSIQWHLAQIYAQVELTASQKDRAIAWLKQLLSSPDADWIAAANAMDTLVQFAQNDSVPSAAIAPLLRLQQQHKSASVVRRATKLLQKLSTR